MKDLSNELVKKDEQRKYIEEILLNNGECYNLLIKDSSNAIIMHNKNKFLYANKRTVNMFGFNSLEELRDKSVLEVFPEFEKGKENEIFPQLYDGSQKVIISQEKLMNANGNTFIVKHTSTCFIYKGQPTILTILHDITSEKQVEKLQGDVEENIKLLNESRGFNKMITEFFTNISHEL